MNSPASRPSSFKPSLVPKSGLGKDHPEENALLLFAIGFMLFASAFVLSCSPSEMVDRKNCQGQLSAIGSLIHLHRSLHDKAFPESLEALEDPDIARVLKCPGAKRILQNDYVYVNWSKTPYGPDITSGKYPVVYDRSLSNHGGRGINILMFDGTVEWDPGAKWLQAFAANHKGANLTLPR